ncbi:MAG: hypothetical protein ACE148_07845 [Vicinamibacterales bacterium]
MKPVAVFAVLAASAAMSASAQEKAPGALADAASAEAIVSALYEVISGPAGQPRDWKRFRNLFAPGARLVSAAPRRDGAAPVALSPDDYIARTSDSLVKNGFFEKQVSRRVESFGTITHVFSTYESRRAAAEATPMARGINSIQLMKHADRWWIVTVMWDQERPDNPIPAKYLGGK